MTLDDAINSRGDSTLCVSLSSNPGTFGTRVHNTGYKALGLNFKYIACQENDIARAMRQVRDSGIRGASISMPFKLDVMKHLDSIDEQALRTEAVNTVVNQDGHLRGYNTDVDGFKALIEEANIDQNDRITVVGTGGVARAVLEALRGFQNVVICGRNFQQRYNLATKYGVGHFSYGYLELVTGTVINCTPIGMQGEIFPVSVIGLSRAIDVVVKDTPFIRNARGVGIPSFSGAIMSLHGAANQFKLYTEHDAPLEIMREAAGV